MKHLDDAAAVALAEGNPPAGAHDHAAACSPCAGRVERLRRLLGSLAEGPGEAPPERLLRWARAHARTAARPAPRSSLLAFLCQGAPLEVAVRGGHAAGRALLFGDASHHLDLRLEGVTGGRTRLHGQLVPLAGGSAGGWTVSVVTSEGVTHSTTTDADGEFWLEVGVGREPGASLVASRGQDRLVVARLAPEEVGTEP